MDGKGESFTIVARIMENNFSLKVYRYNSIRLAYLFFRDILTLFTVFEKGCVVSKDDQAVSKAAQSENSHYHWFLPITI